MSNDSPFSAVAKQAMLQPQETLMGIKKQRKELYIGIPKETSYQENRIAITPLSAGLLVANGHEVWVESNAGKATNFSDKEYSEVGAKIVYDVKEVYKADILIKVAPPSMEEVEMMQKGQTLISAIHLATLSEDYIRKIMSKNITAICYEYFGQLQLGH